jgi:hypothetical protein
MPQEVADVRSDTVVAQFSRVDRYAHAMWGFYQPVSRPNL